MTLYALLNKIERTIAKQPNVKSLVRSDIYKLNDIPNALYSVMGWTMGTHRIDTRTNLATYQLYLYYIDRNIPDTNREHEIISFGIQCLNNIVFTIKDQGIYIDDYDIQPFTQRFADDCAGVYAVLNIDVPVDICYETYTGLDGDYNNDYNDDFLISAGIKTY